MKPKLPTMLLMMLAGWVNRHQQDMIEYLKEENKILREKLGKKRLLLNDDQRRRLAVLGRRLSRKALEQVCQAFSPDTLIRWHRDLIARKYDGTPRRGLGRPQISEELRAAILKVAKDNRDWGYIRIRGQLKYLGFKVSVATIGNILKKAGLEPQPDRKRKTTWAEFIKSHWQSLAAADFFTTEVYTIKGLTRYMVFVVIDYATRKHRLLSQRRQSIRRNRSRQIRLLSQHLGLLEQSKDDGVLAQLVNRFGLLLRQAVTLRHIVW